MNDIYLSLGSNITPQLNLPAAVRLLRGYGEVASVSSVWETAPVGYTDQPNFLNAAIHLRTEYSVETFQQEFIPKIESQLGRVRGKNKFGPRSIDIDIMLYNQQVLTIEDRHIPSPEIYERAFVAIPLAEIAPDYVHPRTGETLEEIAQKFENNRTGMTLRPEIQLTSGC